MGTITRGVTALMTMTMINVLPGEDSLGRDPHTVSLPGPHPTESGPSPHGRQQGVHAYHHQHQ
jgi:hypothetical protein